MRLLIKYLNMPILSLGLVLFVYMTVIIFNNGFVEPDYYIDKVAASDLINNISIFHKDVLLEYENKSYKINNLSLQLFLIVFSFFLASLFFKIKTWKEFLTKPIFKNRVFVYCFINLIYPIWATFQTISYMTDINKFVYAQGNDSIGISLLCSIFSMIYLSLLYYPLINFIIFIAYNTQITSFFYSLIYVIITMILLILFVLQASTYIFSWYLLPQYFVYIVLILIMINTNIEYIKRKILYKKNS